MAGHVIECGAQCCGGNYAFFEEVPGRERIGFPLAEVHPDGSSVITKHPGTGGAVTVGTVTAQLLYEIGGPRYLSPDAVARFDSIELSQDGPDRVRIAGVRGEPPPPTLKVTANLEAGWRNSMTLALTGAQVAEKARFAADAVWAGIPGGRAAFAESAEDLSGDLTGGGMAYLRLAVRGDDEQAVGRAFSGAVVETSLSSYPGTFFTSAPSGAQGVARYWPTTVAATCGDAARRVRRGRGPGDRRPGADASRCRTATTPRTDHPVDRRAPARPGRTWCGCRCGCSSARARATREETPTSGCGPTRTPSPPGCNGTSPPRCSGRSCPRSEPFAVSRYPLPNLRAVNFVVHGVLGWGVASNLRLDTQAKGLGELLRSRWVDVPASLVSRRAGRQRGTRRPDAAPEAGGRGIWQDGAMESIARLVALVAGIAIVVLTVWSVFTSLVLPRATSSRMMRGLARVAGCGRRARLAPRLPTYEVRDRVLSFVGPAAIVVAVRALAGADPAGLLADHLVGHAASTSLDALGVAGSSVITLGIATANGAGPRTLEILAAGIGLGVVALEIAYLPALYNAFATRETEVTLLSARGGTPAWGPEILARPLLARHHGRAPAAVRRVGALGLRRVGEPRQLPRAHLVPLTGVVAQLAGGAGGHDGLGRALPLREPAADAAPGAAVPVDGHPLPALHGRCAAHPLRPRSPAERRPSG